MSQTLQRWREGATYIWRRPSRWALAHILVSCRISCKYTRHAMLFPWCGSNSLLKSHVNWMHFCSNSSQNDCHLCALRSANLDIVRQLNDHVAEGRACGNLGNTHYLLGNFSLAVSFHQEVNCWLSYYFRQCQHNMPHAVGSRFHSLVWVTWRCSNAQHWEAALLVVR